MRFTINFKMGRIVRYFILADLALLAGWGLIEPVFAVFILDRVQGATVITLGISAAIYWLVKSVIQIPIALFLDKTPSERDDYIFLVVGLILAGITSLSFILVDRIWQLYLVQFMHAVAFAFYVPSWSGIFARHLDQGHQAFDFTLDSAIVGLSSGVASFLSGLLVVWFGYNTIFVLGALFSFVSSLVVFSVPQVVFPHRRHRGPIWRDHSPKTIRK